MSEQVYFAAVVLGGACVLAVILAAILALFLGRSLRAQGVARIGGHSEFSVRVEVPAGAPNAERPGHGAELARGAQMSKWASTPRAATPPPSRSRGVIR